MEHFKFAYTEMFRLASRLPFRCPYVWNKESSEDRGVLEHKRKDNMECYWSSLAFRAFMLASKLNLDQLAFFTFSVSLLTFETLLKVLVWNYIASLLCCLHRPPCRVLWFNFSINPSLKCDLCHTVALGSQKQCEWLWWFCRRDFQLAVLKTD